MNNRVWSYVGVTALLLFLFNFCQLFAQDAVVDSLIQVPIEQVSLRDLVIKALTDFLSPYLATTTAFAAMVTGATGAFLSRVSISSRFWKQMASFVIGIAAAIIGQLLDIGVFAQFTIWGAIGVGIQVAMQSNSLYNLFKETSVYQFMIALVEKK